MLLNISNQTSHSPPNISIFHKLHDTLLSRIGKSVALIRSAHAAILNDNKKKPHKCSTSTIDHANANPRRTHRHVLILSRSHFQGVQHAETPRFHPPRAAAANSSVAGISPLDRSQTRDAPRTLYVYVRRRGVSVIAQFSREQRAVALIARGELVQRENAY